MARWPFIGRDDELDFVGSSVRGAHPRGVVVVGDPGVGRTRFLAACGSRLGRSGPPVLRAVTSRSSSDVPFAAVAALLPHAHEDVGVAVDQQAAVIRRALARWSERRRPTVLLIDDAHLLDSASAALVHQLTVAGGVLPVLTVQSGRRAPAAVTTLWKDELVEYLDLPRFGAEAYERLLVKALGGPVDGAVVAQFVEHTRANLLLLRELVRGALHDGVLVQDGGLWRLCGPLTPSRRLVDLVEDQLNDLDVAERELLQVVAFGEPLGEVEARAVGTPPLFERLANRRLIRCSRADGELEVRIGEPVVGDVLRGAIPAMRVPEIGKSLADALEAAGLKRRADTVRVARWHLETGSGSARLMLSAAVQARWRSEFALAERLVHSAIAKGAGFQARVLLAHLLGLQGRTVQAEAELQRLALEASNDNERGLVAISRLDNQFWVGHSDDDALRIVAEALDAIEIPGWRHEVQARQVNLLLATDGPARAIEVGEWLLDHAEGVPLVHAHCILAYCLGRVGRLHRAAEVAQLGHQRHLALARSLELYPASWHIFFRCEALACCGRLAEAESLALEHYRRAVSAGSIEGQAILAWHLSKIACDRGHVETAEVYGREAVGAFRQLGRLNFAAWCTCHLAIAVALAGKSQEALSLLETVRTTPTVTVSLSLDLLHARAWTAAAAGDLPGACGHLEEAAALAHRRGDRAGEAAVLHTLARFGRAKEVRLRLRELATEIDGELALARAAHAEALARGDAAQLDEVAQRFEGMGADLLAAEASVDAAVGWNRRREPRKATASGVHAQSVSARCEGATTPALLAAHAPSHLTRAERDVAMLAAAGRSNKEIAAELHLSVRTIETQLYSVYSKLGLKSRSELAEALTSLRRGASGGDRVDTPVHAR